MSLIAQGLYDNVLAIVGNKKLTVTSRLKLLHETLVVTCAQALKDTRYGFGDLNSQLESVMRLFNIHGDEADALRQARRDSNRSHFDGDTDEDKSALLYDEAHQPRAEKRDAGDAHLAIASRHETCQGTHKAKLSRQAMHREVV